MSVMFHISNTVILLYTYKFPTTTIYHMKSSYIIETCLQIIQRRHSFKCHKLLTQKIPYHSDHVYSYVAVKLQDVTTIINSLSFKIKEYINIILFINNSSAVLPTEIHIIF